MMRIAQTLWLLLCTAMLSIWLVLTLIKLHKLWKG